MKRGRQCLGEEPTGLLVVWKGQPEFLMPLIPSTQLSHKQPPGSCIWGLPLQQPTLRNTHWIPTEAWGWSRFRRLNAEPGSLAFSQRHTNPAQLPASAPSQRASPWGHPSPRPEENPGCHVHVGAGSPGPADWTGAVTRPQRRQSESLMLLGIGN